MEREAGQRLARPLGWLVTGALVCDIIVIVYLPLILALRAAGLQAVLAQEVEAGRMITFLLLEVPLLWAYVTTDPRALLLVGSLALCGGCAAVILVQARRILVTIARRDPFCHANAKALGRASWACFGVSAVALARLAIEMLVFHELAALATYNALAVPVFCMGGLLFRVMAALFHQAARMKEEQELTI